MPEISIHDLNALQQFSELFVAHGLDYSKEGQKDFARDVVRFLRNGRVVQILTTAGFDCSKLQGDLNWLSLACHPQDVPDFKPDLKAIRDSLARIEARLDSPQSFSASSIEHDRAGRRGEAPPALPCLLLTTASATLVTSASNHESE